MASVYLSGRSWVARYVPVHGKLVKARRVPRSVAPAEDTPAASKLALGWAAECERYCRLLENQPLPDQVRHAQELGIIPDDRAEQLLSGPSANVLPTLPDPSLVTLLDAAQAHPSSQREPLAEQVKHLRGLNNFIAHAAIDRLDQLTVDQVLAYVDHLKEKKKAWDSRRHALLWIRRASSMAPSYRQHDLLRDLHIDSRVQAEAPEIAALTLDQLRATLAAVAPSQDKPDIRPRVAIALGGLLGLRPSECYRLQVGDIDLVNAVIRIGVREAKNASSRRDLPLPPTLVTWLSPMVANRPAAALLIECRGFHWHTKTRDGVWTASTYTQWLGPILRTASGAEVPAKTLRKTFATWAVERLSLAQLEAFLGHRFSGASDVTARHYLARLAVEKLRPAAAIIEQSILSPIMTAAPVMDGATQARNH